VPFINIIKGINIAKQALPLDINANKIHGLSLEFFHAEARSTQRRYVDFLTKKVAATIPCPEKKVSIALLCHLVGGKFVIGEGK